MSDERLVRLSFNTATTGWRALRQVAGACRRRGIASLGLWREDLQREGIDRCVALLRELDLTVSSLCRGGFFAAPDGTGRRERIEDNLRAIDEAVTVGAPTLILVCGGMNNCSLEDARAMVADGIAAIADHAEQAGVCLGIEPLHPMYTADRSVVVTLEQALGLARAHPQHVVGVVIDAFHVWWDPNLYALIERARGRTVGFHVDDWAAPVTDHLMARRVMGDGVIDLHRLMSAVDAGGYAGPIEIEVLSSELAALGIDEVVDLVVARYIDLVAEGEARGV